MTDNPNANDPLSQRCAQVEEQGSTAEGKQAWDAAMRGLQHRMAAGDLSQRDVIDQLGHADAAGRLFADGIAATDEASWRAWRDRQPKRAAMLDRVAKDNGRR
jgi:hypothetical protein